MLETGRDRAEPPQVGRRRPAILRIPTLQGNRPGAASGHPCPETGTLFKILQRSGPVSKNFTHQDKKIIKKTFFLSDAYGLSSDEIRKVKIKLVNLLYFLRKAGAEGCQETLQNFTFKKFPYKILTSSY